MIVEAGPDPGGAELFRAAAQLFSDLLPAVEVLNASCAGHHDELAAEDVVQLNRFPDLVGVERIGSVVRGEALHPHIVEQFADLFRIIRGPLHVGRVELHAFIAELCNATDRAHQIIFEKIANRVEFKPDRDALPGGQNGAGGTRHREQSTTRNFAGHSRAKISQSETWQRYRCPRMRSRAGCDRKRATGGGAPLRGGLPHGREAARPCGRGARH